jgi:hypothetical protein
VTIRARVPKLHTSSKGPLGLRVVQFVKTNATAASGSPDDKKGGGVIRRTRWCTHEHNLILMIKLDLAPTRGLPVVAKVKSGEISSG